MSADLSPLIRRLASVSGVGSADESDAALLRCFACKREETAFTALVQRHGRMVLEVCRSVLGNHADAEDAFQATFLVLARNAASIRKPHSLAHWLYGVAHRTARKALAARARQRQCESRVPAREVAEPNDRTWGEVQVILHEELFALPERLRAVLVLCYLQGLTQDAAAEALSLTKAAVKKRLERGRDQLRAALVRRGLGPAAVLAAFACPATLVQVAVSTTTASATSGAVPPHILRLAEGGAPMTLGKLTTTVVVLPLLALGAVFAGVGGQSRPTETEQPAKPPAAAAAQDKKETPAEREKKWLAGEWKVAFIEANGVDALSPFKIPDEARFTFEDDIASVKGFEIEFFKSFTFKLDPTRTPKQIDVTFTAGEMKGKTFEGCYVTMQNEVRMCLRLEKTNLGRPKGFSTVSGTGLYTFFLRPVKEKDPPPKFAPVDYSAPPMPNPNWRKVLDDIPVPAKPPFDADAKKKEEYLTAYRDGHFWAMGNHLYCPTNPSDSNLHVIRGWVEGWQAGVKAGGTGDLPAKYAPFLVWRESDAKK